MNIFTPILLNFWVFISFSLGIVLAYFLSWFIFYIAFTLIFLSLSYFYYKKNKLILSDIFILLVFVTLGSCWLISQDYYLNKKLTLQNYIILLKPITIPQEYKYRNSLLAQVKKISGNPYALQIRVFDYTKTMQYLNCYLVEGRLSLNPKNKKKYILWVGRKNKVEEKNLLFIEKKIKSLAYYLQNLFKTNLSEQSFRLLSSIFLGRRELARAEEIIFTNAGVTHLIAISGQHIALIASIIFFILKLIGIKFRPRLIISLFFLTVYSVIAGLSASTLRSLIMYIIFAFAFLIKRQNHALNCFGLAGYVSLLINPYLLFDLGFQLSFLSVLALIIGFSLPAKKIANPIINNITNTFWASLYVTLFITPLISFYFGKIYLLSIIYNIILIPLFSIILILTVIFIAFGPISFITLALGQVLSILISLFLYLTYWLGKIPFTFIYYYCSLSFCVIYYFLLIGFIFYKIKKNDQ